MNLNIHNTFNTELPADQITENYTRQVEKAFFSYVSPKKPIKPELIHVSREMLKEIEWVEEDRQRDRFLNIFSGTEVLENTRPYAMCYGGHQFGVWAGQLGDGRAINLFEVENSGKRWALQLKGAGRTPYSRTADGNAVLRSSIREHLCSEAMYHLGIPTTRSLSLMLSGEKVLRDILYNGNPAYEKGAIVCRAASSFIRFGNFQIFSSRKDLESLRLLADYTIRHFYPSIQGKGNEKYIQFFREVSVRTLDMVLHWQRVGFVHGVMNTDNMSILGLTIDYGPYGWLEDYDPNWTPNTTDAEGKRYRFGHQPNIALWNLVQLANALYPLIGDAKPLEEILDDYRAKWFKKYFNMMGDKLGLKLRNEEERHVVDTLENLLQESETDMTIFYRTLAQVSKEDEKEKAFERVEFAFYNEEKKERNKERWLRWFSEYLHRLGFVEQTNEERREGMNRRNPKYVLRNYMAQMAIDEADKGNYKLINELYELLKEPYNEQPENEKWFAKRPDWAKEKPGCSMLSCSS